MLGSFPKKLSKIIGVHLLVLLKFKPASNDFWQNSIVVGQFTIDPDLVNQFTYTGLPKAASVKY